MPFRYVRQLFTDGMNEDMDPSAIDLGTEGTSTITKVVSTQNMVFERGLVVTRPSTTVDTITGLDANTVVVGATSIPMPAIVYGISVIPNTMVVLGVATGVYSIYSVCMTAGGGFLVATKLTGASLGTPAGIGGPTPASFSIALVNQAVLIGGFPNGLVRWLPPASTYTLVDTQATPASWLFMAKLYSRAIGAYAIGGAGGFINPITIGASAAGDEQDWVSASAYKTVLSDVPDEITGLGVIKGTVVVPRRYGFHLGAATGQSPAVFTWAAYTDNAIGCLPGTFQVYNNLAFFMSEVGIHVFDLVSITDIGEGIYTSIANLYQNGASLQTFISYAYRQDFQPCYNIVVVNAFGNANFHFMYNIKEGKWSQHFYSSNGGSAFPSALGTALRIQSSPSGVLHLLPAMGFVAQTAGATTAPFMLLRGGNYKSGPESPIVEACTITCAAIALQPSYEDTALTRVMVVIYAAAPGAIPSLVVTSYLDGVSTSITFTTTDTTLNVGWNYVWFNGRSVGQNFQPVLTLSTPSTCPSKVKEMWYEFTVAGKQRN